MSSFRRRLLLVSALGLLVRLVAGYLNRHHVVLGDALTFHLEGRLLADGDGFRRVAEDVPTAEHPPLHIVVLAAADLAGLHGLTAQRLLQGAIGTLTVTGCGLLGRRVAGEAAGLLAAGVAAVYPMLWLPDTAIMSETTYGVTIVASLLAAFALRDRPSAWRAAILGATIALATLTRGEALALTVLLLGPAAWLAAAGDRRVFVRLAVVGALAFAVVLAPWAIRNATTFDARVLVSTNGDGVWVGANCPATYRGELVGSWVFSCYGEAPPGDEARQAVAYRRRGLRYARQNAGRLPVVVLARLGRLLDVYRPWTQGIFFNASEGRGTRASRLALLAWWALAPLAVAGALVLRRRRRAPGGREAGADAWVLLLAPVAMVLAVGTVVYGSTRFRFAAEPSVVVLAAVSAQALLSRVTRAGRAAGRRGGPPPPAPAAAPPARAPAA